MSVIGALLYLANCTRPDNILGQLIGSVEFHYNSTALERNQTHILLSVKDVYSNESKLGLIGYADVGYLFDPHKA